MDILNVIIKTLEGFPSMARVMTVSALASAFTSEDIKRSQLRRFFVRKADEVLLIRFAEQLDVEVDAIVRDGELGSLGLIHLVPTTGPIEDWLRRRVDESAYLRHLLLEQVRPGADDAGKTAYAVELVFVFPIDPASPRNGAPEHAATPNPSEQLGEVLRTIIREAGYLHALGVNVWRVPSPGDGPGDPVQVRRAFAWLLKDTEAWYRAIAERAHERDRFGQLGVVELENFRIAGRRKWTLESGQRLHLVHGHNGSGKSSFCEVLELVVTGRVERLGKADHIKVLTFRPAQPGAKAAVVLKAIGEDERKWIIDTGGIAKPLQGPPGSSFRMDQGLADRLSHADPATRARIFLDAFFPGEREELQKRDDGWQQLTTIYGKLPQRMRSDYASDVGEPDPAKMKPDPTKIKNSLTWLANPSVPWEKVMALLAISPEEIAPVMPLLPQEFVKMYQRTGEVTESYIKSVAPALQQGLKDLVADFEKKVQALDQAVEVLKEYGSKAVISLPAEAEELGLLMNRWLQHVALADILEREGQLLAAVKTAKEKGHLFEKDVEPLLARATEAPLDGSRQELIQRRRDELRRRVLRRGTQTEREAGVAKALKPLTEFRLESLDVAAALGVFDPAYQNAAPRLAQAVRQAFTERKVIEVWSGGSPLLRIGDVGWGADLLEKAVRIRDGFKALASLQNDVRKPEWTLDKLWPDLTQLREAAVALESIDAKLLDVFTRQVGGGGLLSCAVNELMALLTPARWAYEDIVTRAEFASGKTSLELETSDEVAVQLRLNTAELNTFAMTLFLLCAPRIKNKLRIIVLDDPLQNMDELTVTNVARGLGRLLRLWKRFDGEGFPWRLVIFLHSEQDVECFRSEVPCSTYLLPWLSPQESANEPVKETRVVPSILRPELQRLEQLLVEAPR